MYVSMKEMLQKANREKLCRNGDQLLQFGNSQSGNRSGRGNAFTDYCRFMQDHLKEHLDIRYLTQPIIRMANNAKVEVAINLDHGQDVAFVKQCLHEGISSVMMDASMYSLEENIRITKAMVELAQVYNASVEAEVGDMGAVAGDHFTNDEMYTDPDDAIRFINETGVDCLALSYGSSHGDYPEGYVPDFRFDIVEKIKAATNLPLVLHGGSGAGEKNILRSIELGINKINVGFYEGAKAEVQKQLAENPEVDYPTLVHQTMAAGKEVVKRYIELSGSKK